MDKYQKENLIAYSVLFILSNISVWLLYFISIFATWGVFLCSFISLGTTILFFVLNVEYIVAFVNKRISNE